MRVGLELRKWLDDRAAHSDARARADAFAHAWNAGPINRLFDEAMTGLDPLDAETVAKTMVRILEDDGAIEMLVGELATRLRENPFFEPPFRRIGSEIHSGLIVFEHDWVTVAAGVTSLARLAEKKRRDAGRGSIAFSGQVELFKFVKAGGARLAIWEAPRIGPEFRGAAAGQCRKARDHALQDGEIIVVDGREQSFIIEHALANLIVVHASVKLGRAPLSVEYDSFTREYVGCSAADDSASRIQMITTLLRKLDHAAAVPALAAFLDHPDFFLRWHVMREMLGLDVHASLPHLRRMAAGDPHPETRRAARQVLERIEPSPSLRDEAA